MARRVHDKTLDSRDARRRLKIRGKPYYRAIERGLHLGYRRLGGDQAGTWVARHYIGGQQYEVERLGKWMTDLATTPARLRTREGLKQQYAPLDSADAKRARKASANRTMVVLRAALNRAWRDGKVASNAEWSRVAPFENVNVARIRYLKIDEAKRLINGCDPDFRFL